MSAKEKNGCSVTMTLVCTDEEGRRISDIPSGGWYGLPRQMANILAQDISNAVVGIIDGYNKKMFGDDYHTNLLPKSGPKK